MSDNLLINLLGKSLFIKEEEKQTHSICGKDIYLGLYFSAYCCSSCIAFTPELVKFYRNFKRSEKKNTFEIIYISSDTDEAQFMEHYGSMPWFSVPFKYKDRQLELARHFRVQSIPSLVIIESETGEVVTSYGRSCVLDDPDGLYFPWKMRNSIDIFREISLISSTGDTLPYDSLSSHIKGLYFSAHWCPPCKAFTPALVKLYKKLKKSGLKFEVIFISSDRSEQSFKQYFSAMPWLAVPYSEEKSRKELTYTYGVGGIPSFIILSEDNSIITKEGRVEVNDDPDGEEFPWRQKLVDELGEKHISKLNEEPCLIFFTVCEDKELELAHYMILPVAEEYQARLKRASAEDSPIPHLNFFYAGDAEVCDSVRDVVGIGYDFPFLVILDIPNGKKYIRNSKDPLTSEAIGKFVREFISQKLTASAIGL